MKQPLWTTIIRTRGSGNHTLEETIGSVINQTYPKKSIILVIHDPKGQNAPAIRKLVTKLNREISITLLHGDPKKKRGNPINVGLDFARKHTKPQFASILDDDDIFYPEMGEVLIGRMLEEKANFAYGNTIISRRTPYRDGFAEIGKGKGYGEPFNPVRLVAENYLHLSSVIFSPRQFPDANIHEDMDLWEDWYLLLSLLFSGKLKPVYVNSTVSEYRIIGQQDSNSFHRFSRKEIERNYGIIKDLSKNQSLTISYQDVFRIYPELALIAPEPNDSDIQKLLNTIKAYEDIARRKLVKFYLAAAKRFGKLPDLQPKKKSS
ncbi:MAG: glycosyltransferase family A protein [Candidatus Dojkabacteria bacterium]|nr:glycosyltransferase family A protein [Candidatus Dojkabacteria bacterium]